MSARFLLRFDDVCPTMNWEIWNEVEKLLIEYRVSPIVAIVPDNVDEKLKVESPVQDFWKRVRGWQDRGWTIGLHGYQHRYVTSDSGLVGLNRYSEFAGLPEDVQQEKIRKGMVIFRRNGIQPTIWVAPAHSFDKYTIRALSRAGIGMISDGFALWPYRDENGMQWIPQQVWRFRKLPAGVWTICYHTNDWKRIDIDRFRAHLLTNHHRISTVEDAVKLYAYRRRSIIDDATGVGVRVGIWMMRQLHAKNRTAVPKLPINNSQIVDLARSTEQADSSWL
jgi:predicted deacetylase